MQSSLLDSEVCPLLKIRYLITFIHFKDTASGLAMETLPQQLLHHSTMYLLSRSVDTDIQKQFLQSILPQQLLHCSLLF